MSSVFVFYNDGYAEDGDVGLSEFENIEQAADFIELRIASDSNRKLTDYKVIVGVEKNIEAVEMVKRVKIF